MTLISMDERDCCIVHNKDPDGGKIFKKLIFKFAICYFAMLGSCDCSALSSPGNVFVKEASRMVGEALINLEDDNKATSGRYLMLLLRAHLDCMTQPYDIRHTHDN